MNGSDLLLIFIIVMILLALLKRLSAKHHEALLLERQLGPDQYRWLLKQAYKNFSSREEPIINQVSLRKALSKGITKLKPFFNY